jgi:hypothetical protein
MSTGRCARAISIGPGQRAGGCAACGIASNAEHELALALQSYVTELRAAARLLIQVQCFQDDIDISNHDSV